jgi:hypothetical protein
MILPFADPQVVAYNLVLLQEIAEHKGIPSFWVDTAGRIDVESNKVSAAERRHSRSVMCVKAAFRSRLKTLAMTCKGLFYSVRDLVVSGCLLRYSTR